MPAFERISNDRFWQIVLKNSVPNGMAFMLH